PTRAAQLHFFTAVTAGPGLASGLPIFLANFLAAGGPDEGSPRTATLLLGDADRHARVRRDLRWRARRAGHRRLVRESAGSRQGIQRSQRRSGGRADPRLLDAVPRPARAATGAPRADLLAGRVRWVPAAGRALASPARLVRDRAGLRRRGGAAVGAQRHLAAALAAAGGAVRARLPDRDQRLAICSRSRSKPGRIALKNALRTRPTSVGHVPVLGFSTGPEIGTTVATSLRGRFLRILLATSIAFSFTFWPNVLSWSLSFS